VSEQLSDATAVKENASQKLPQLRRPLFAKYFLALFVAVTMPTLIYGASEAWFGYLEKRSLLNQRLQVEARAASNRIEDFLDGIREQMGWTVQFPWTDAGMDRHRLDAWRLLRQVPAIVEMSLIDGNGIERLRISRLGRDIIESGLDRSNDSAFLRARKSRVWFGPVDFHRGSEPYMTISVAGNRRAVGIAAAQINLKLVWEVVTSIRVGESGIAFVSDRSDHLIAHPDLSLVLRGSDERMIAWLAALQETASTEVGSVFRTEDTNGRTVLVAMAPVAVAGWNVFVALPLSEAFSPIRKALWRTGAFVLVGTVFAAFLGWVFAGRMTQPIRQVEQGVANIGAGHFDYRINLTTGDELERLANRVNIMAGELAVSRDRAERVSRLKQFLSPQVAELVEDAGHSDLLAAKRVEVVVVFCDLRGFTAFASKADAADVMQVLDEYYGTLGTIIQQFEATLTQFSGDGMMVLLNAPVSCPENPIIWAIEMSLKMQDAIQSLTRSWREQGYELGFGIGLANGTATVGKIGYEGRSDYTAIGSVANLASRLCDIARDGQVLLDADTASELRGEFELETLGEAEFKGLGDSIVVYSVSAKMST
jgi:class 3 adenylate cyclase